MFVTARGSCAQREMGGGGGGWEGGEDVCEHFRWATCYCRGWNLPKNAKGNLLGEQRCGCELPGSRARPCFCISCPRHEPHPEPAAPAGAVGHAASRGGRAVNPSGSRARLLGRRSDFWLYTGCQGGQHRGLPAQILLLCGNFPLERLLHFLTRRLMEGGRGKGRSAGISSLVSKQACSR